MIQFIHTDFPDPVAPATSKWGVVFISVHFTLPIMSFPSPTARMFFLFVGGIIERTSLKDTDEFTLLGSSIPIVFFPGMGAWILTSLAARARAISLWMDNSLLTLVPAFNSSSYWVTVGPIFTWTIFPLISKTARICSSLDIDSLA